VGSQAGSLVTGKRKVKKLSTFASLFVGKQAAQNIAMLMNQKPTWELVATEGKDITMSGVKAVRVHNSSMTTRQLQQLKTWYMSLF
jgi:hypothetical protein